MSDYTPPLAVVRGDYARAVRYSTGAVEAHAEFDRAIAKVRAEAKAEALREAADIVGSEEAEQWRRDRGGAYGVSAPGAQIVAQRMQIVGGIIRARADTLATP